MRYLPLFKQASLYDRDKFASDMIAAMVVTIMLIPQSLAYAMLAGLPPQYGLYASVLPIVVYSLLGSSSTLAVGPVAIASIMTATSLSAAVEQGVVGYVEGAVLLAFLSGLIMLVLGFFKAGLLANFLSHSVVSGFIAASGLLIAASQFKHILGVQIDAHSFFETCVQLIKSMPSLDLATTLLGIGSIAFLLFARNRVQGHLQRLGLSAWSASITARMAPIVGVLVTSLIVYSFGLDQQSVKTVGSIPSGLGEFAWPEFSIDAIKVLFMPALLISIIGYVESISVGRTLAAKRGEKIDADQELLALGGANLASGIAGAFPVTGGFARSVVNFDAGARTPFAGLFTAIGIALASLFLTQYLYYLPIAMLAATIIVAVLSLVDLSVVTHAWQLSKSDFLAVIMTVLMTLVFGVEAGVASGIIASILLHLYHTSVPHIAEIGLTDESGHFRNVRHYKVETRPDLVSLRIDESLLFSNAQYLDDYIMDLVMNRPGLEHVVIHCGAINTVDLTGIEMLQELNQKLMSTGVSLHLSELKVPVKNLLARANFLDQLSGGLYLSHLQAYRSI